MPALSINQVWKDKIESIMIHGDECAPRGQKIKEFIGDKIVFDMNDPIITLAERNLNYSFAFGEAWWICSGSNKLADIAAYMKSYANYSDDGIVLNGAYGPKFVDQLRYVTDTLIADPDTRQAVINIWRENPRPTKDVPCTLNLQFLIRDEKIHTVVNMRSQDMIWGFGYDSFTFTMMTKVIQTMLNQRTGKIYTLGTMTINQGSAHIYEKHWHEIKGWVASEKIVSQNIRNEIDTMVKGVFGNYDIFIDELGITGGVLSK